MPQYKITDLQVVASYTSIPGGMVRRPLPPTISLELSKQVMKHIDVAAARHALRALPKEEHAEGKKAAESFEPKALAELRKALDGASSIKQIEFDKRPPIYIPSPPVHEIIRPLLIATRAKADAAQWVLTVTIEGKSIECWVCFLIRVEDVESAAARKAAAPKKKKAKKKSKKRMSKKASAKGRRR